MESPTGQIFSEYHSYLKAEHDMREEIRASVQELEQSGREILTILQRVHTAEGQSQISQLCDQGESQFALVRQQYEALAKIVPKDQYYRFHDHWRFVNQRLCFLASFLVYLQTEQLVTKQQVAATLGVAEKREEGFHIDLDDFLTGLLSMANELSRLAVNSVIAGDYSRPIKISKFVGNLNAGFRQLNLKNDALRKRFDALKYDLKKIEEVVYDLSIRGLNPEGQDSQASGSLLVRAGSTVD